ncbi:AAA family ATPase [Rodentibacter caecimuris]|uniref:AAA family ATPase n=1 Tax=Rodentibacter caecimuris TaxID=1796644 RepID=UPI00211A89D4|nr:AAA family ATPase [Rodentibacter heylii]MCQ9124717.1 AAA family ATPase [Rodentibacter heylii]MCX2962293.1 AAA family ATPase [Rodentibacter heylii]
MIVIVGCNKGGAAKTTTAVNVAIGLAMQGKDICLVDADAQRSASRWYSEREISGIKPNITLIEKRDNLSQTLKQLNDKFDHVIVDVAGRNSKELITGGTVADFIIAPHQCSQLDLDTLIELQMQVDGIRTLNPDLRVYCYQTMATTNPILKEKERAEFVEFISEFKDFTILKSVGHYRKVYRDVMTEGKSVLETSNEQAKNEILGLIEEVF